VGDDGLIGTEEEEIIALAIVRCGVSIIHVLVGLVLLVRTLLQVRQYNKSGFAFSDVSRIRD